MKIWASRKRPQVLATGTPGLALLAADVPDAQMPETGFSPFTSVRTADGFSLEMNPVGIRPSFRRFAIVILFAPLVWLGRRTLSPDAVSRWRAGAESAVLSERPERRICLPALEQGVI